MTMRRSRKAVQARRVPGALTRIVRFSKWRVASAEMYGFVNGKVWLEDSCKKCLLLV